MRSLSVWQPFAALAWSQTLPLESVVMEILEAAWRSAATGQTIRLSAAP